MIRTDIKINGIPISFDNSRALCNYMEQNNIASCNAISTIASVDIFSSVVTLDDVRKWVVMDGEN